MNKLNFVAMNTLILKAILVVFLLIGPATILRLRAQRGEELPAKVYADKLSGMPQAQVLDVRTKEEFSGNHLKNAFHADYNNPSEFHDRIQYLDKNRPVFVYCLSGGRSAKAVEILREKGFTEVYNLQGGIRSWQASRLPLETPGPKNTGMTKGQFEAMLMGHGQKLVLVDFGARWCPPCKKMAPALDSLATEMASTAVVIPLDVEEHTILADDMKVSTLPRLMLYKNGTLVWQHEGYTGKEKIVEAIGKHSR